MAKLKLMPRADVADQACRRPAGRTLGRGPHRIGYASGLSRQLSGPFIFDDLFSIEGNPTIRKLWPIWKTLCPPNHGETVTGRPLLNLSLAINYAASGLDVWSYHAGNLLIHVLAALLLFGILRRTFLLPALAFCTLRRYLAGACHCSGLGDPPAANRVGDLHRPAGRIAGGLVLPADAVLLHPRRGFQTERRYWYAGAVLACLLGMASKEVMVSAPLIVLLYDRTFLPAHSAKRGGAVGACIWRWPPRGCCWGGL